MNATRRTRLVNDEAAPRRRWKLAAKVTRSPSGQFHWRVMDELDIVYAHGQAKRWTVARTLARQQAKMLRAGYV